MNFLNYFNNQLSDIFAQTQNVYIYGQNVASGSQLSGLTRNLKLTKSSILSNSPNSENSLVGIGFGAMLRGINAVFCMKQQDFLLLGLDHLVNTNNILRNEENLAGSFTIICIVEDGGYEGPQSASNNLSDFSSFGRINCFSMTNKYDTNVILNENLIKPGFRILGISQRLLSQNLIELECLSNDIEGNLFHYSDGDDVTIICSNFSLPYGNKFCEEFRSRGMSGSLFSINTYLNFNYSDLIQNISKTKKVLIIDDSKSANLLFSDLINEINSSLGLVKSHIIKREYSKDFYYPKSDELTIDYKSIADSFM